MLKKSLIVVLLLITPFAQARAVLICSMMNGEVVEHCCCPDDGDHVAAVRHDVSAGPCCTVAIEVAVEDVAGVASESPSGKRVGHDAPNPTTTAPPAAIVPIVFRAQRPLRVAETPNFNPPRLYLRTARLRL